MAENSFAADVAPKKYNIQYFVPLIRYKILNMFNSTILYNKYYLPSLFFLFLFAVRVDL